MNLVEQTQTSTPRIDETTRTIRGVAILGRRSANGRVYSAAALADVARLAEGVRVFADHVDGRRRRSPRELIGVLRSARVVGDRVLADLRVLSETDWSLIRAAAEREPSAFGLSIQGEGTGPGGGAVRGEVARVTVLRSVDLVIEPATVSGLFESVQHRTLADRLQSLERRADRLLGNLGLTVTAPAGGCDSGGYDALKDRTIEGLKAGTPPQYIYGRRSATKGSGGASRLHDEVVDALLSTRHTSGQRR